MVLWATTAKPGDYGAFAPLVLEAAAAGDRVASPIVDAAAQAIGALAHAIEALGASRIAMVGGLGAAIRPFLPPKLNHKLTEPLFDPTDGAVLLAGGSLPGASAP
jgi:glucosamine kinase